MRPLKQRVQVNGRTGMIIGRTIEATPRYDVRTDDGRIIKNIDANYIRDVAAQKEELL